MLRIMLSQSDDLSYRPLKFYENVEHLVNFKVLRRFYGIQADWIDMRHHMLRVLRPET